MLTAELLDYRRRSGGVVPRLLDPEDPALLALADSLCALVQAHVGHPRGDLDEALRGFDAPDLAARQPKTLPGLARLLLDRCDFEVAAGVDPPALRAAVFDAAAPAWRETTGAAVPGTSSWRSAVLAQAAGRLGMAAGQVDAALFADLEENQRLLGVEPITASGLLYRYNTAQVQGLLLRAEHVRLTADWPEPRRLRQLLRWMKFYGLLYSEEHRPHGKQLALIVDGPLSVLESATRYGLSLAQFFPALLLWPQAWTLDAEVHLGRSRKPGQAGSRLRLQPHPWLRSHLPDQGQWVPEDVRRFVEAFNARVSRDGKAKAHGAPWHVQPAETLLPLPDNRSLVPDFEFRRSSAQGVAAGPYYLEHLPYPNAQTVSERLARLDDAGRRNYLLACRGTPAVRELGEHPQLLTFRRSLLPNAVYAALERLASLRD